MTRIVIVLLLLTPTLAAQTVKLGGYLQVDGRWIADAREEDASTFLIRRARPNISGKLTDTLSYRLMAELGQGRATLEDGWVEARVTPRLAIRAGKFKVPFGQERLLSAQDMPFTERSVANNLAPNRDIGFMLSTGTRFTVDAGVFNGAPDGASVDADNDSGKEVAARVATDLLPKRLRVALAATLGDSDGAAGVAYRTPAQETFFTYLSGTSGDGARTRLSPQLAYAAGPLYASAEVLVSRQELRRAANAVTATNRAWQVTGRWVHGGTIDLAGKVTPGSWELVARAGSLDVDDDVFAGFADPAASARSARSYGAGVNWYPSAPLKLMLSLERTSFDGGRDEETFAGLRVQVAF
jgi:phosphate-selective porin OprO and OprP